MAVNLLEEKKQNTGTYSLEFTRPIRVKETA